MKGQTRSPGIRRAIERARRAGYTVTFREFVADASMPLAFPDMVPGRCDYEKREIVVGTRTAAGTRSRAEILAILEHEIEHAEGAEIATDRPEFGLRCGGRWTGHGGTRS
mgnify:CR=1 FL=1